jgi:hypothetical protein
MRKLFQIKSDWVDSMMWCPSQCWLKILYKGHRWTLYLRWRWEDPWSADLIQGWDTTATKKRWEELRIPFFIDEEVDKCKEAAISAAEKFLAKEYPD